MRAAAIGSALLATAIAGVVVTVAPVASPDSPPAAPPAPLTDAQVVALPGVQRRIDHLAVDPAGKRLFVAALGNGSLEVIDLAAGARVTSVRGLVEPQGVAYLPLLHRVVVATHGGEVAELDDRSFQRVATIPNLGDADNLRFDAAANQLFLGYGEGGIGLVDPASAKIVATVRLPGHPESFRLEESGPRIFVNLPPAHEIAVVDRVQRAVIAHVPLADYAKNYPMSLDERGHRLFVGARQPARLVVIDTSSLKVLAAVPCVGDTDDLFYDARRSRVYVIGGEGYVDVFDASANAAGYPRLQRLATRAGARTGLWSSELDELIVAWPARDGHAAEVHVLRPPPP